MKIFVTNIFVLLITGLALADSIAYSPESGIINRINTIGPLPEAVEGLDTEWAHVIVDASVKFGDFPPIQGDLSQGAETGDPFFFEGMENLLEEIQPGLIRVDMFADIENALSLDAHGNLIIDFTKSDRIVQSLHRAGAEICWNCASWPDAWDGGYPKNHLLFEQFVSQIVKHYNGQGERNIHYIEFWNEPGGFDEKTYTVLAKAAHTVDPGVKIGAPAVMDLNLEAIEEAVRHSVETGTPLDFVSFHLYYKPPGEWPELIDRVRSVLRKYPGKENLELVVTEWGIDAGESGTCDTRFNAAYYSSVLEVLLPEWPGVRPNHFELREGWDWKGPSRDLFGRWGMLTYSNSLPKPVFQAARMWSRLKGAWIQANTSDPRIHAVASCNDTSVSVLIWSYPPEYGNLRADSPLHGPSQLDIPVELTIKQIPFQSTGLLYERYQLDAIHSNINHSPGRDGLERVHQAILARKSPAESFLVPLVLPLHGVTLILLKPAERAPADVEAIADRYQIWAGESATVTIQPRMDETFPLELLSDPLDSEGWKVETVTKEPLTLRITPVAPDIRANRFFTAWIQRPDWGAWGRALLEFRTDTPVLMEEDSWRMDLDPMKHSEALSLNIRNRSSSPIEAQVVFKTDAPLKLRPESAKYVLPASGNMEIKANLRISRDASPGPYNLEAVLRSNVELAHTDKIIYLPMVSHYMNTPPVIDGGMDEWKKWEAVDLGGRENWDGHHLSKWEGPQDCSGRFRSAWDEQYLYFAVEVIDDYHIAPVTNGAMRDYDCIHMGFDLRRDMLNRREFFLEDDCDYGFTFTDRGVAYRFWGAKRPEETPQKVLVAALQQGNTITYEIALPWQEEFEPYAGPREGHIMGFSLYIHDIDPGEEQGFLAWGRGLDWHTKRPALFWSLALVKD